MANETERVELSLHKFYIFNASFCKKEGQEENKILYYYPMNIELNRKIKDVGLAEAIIIFAGNFTDDNGSCRSLHTQKTSQVFYQAERGYWMVMVLNIPKKIRSKNGVDVIEYKGGEVHDRVYRAALKQCYRKFRLFAGSFEMYLESATGMEKLKQRLAEFYDHYLTNFNLATYTVIDALRSIKYQPLDKTLFLRAHNFIGTVQTKFPSIVDTVLLYKKEIICSKIRTTDLYCIHEHLVDTELAKSVPRASIDGGSIVRSTFCDTHYTDFYRNGGYITGPTDWPHCRAALQVYLIRDGALQTFDLVIYRAINLTLCMLLSSAKPIPENFYKKLHALLQQQLPHIAFDVEETLKKPDSTAGYIAKKLLTCTLSNDPFGPKYLFINEKSFKHLSNIYEDKYRPHTDSIPINVMNIIADLNSNMQWDKVDIIPDEQLYQTDDKSAFMEEVLVKTTNGIWIVKRRTHKRQFYVIIFNKKATLLDVTKQAKKLFQQMVKDDVFFNYYYYCFEAMDTDRRRRHSSSAIKIKDRCFGGCAPLRHRTGCCYHRRKETL